MSTAETSAAQVTHAAALAQQNAVDPQAVRDDPALKVKRQRDLATPPKGQKAISTYSPVDARRLAADVLACTNNGSVASRIVRVITINGESKHFEMLTGQDGLTFGLTDWAGSAIPDFFQAFARKFPAELVRLFGADSKHLLDKDWIEANNGPHSGDADYGRRDANDAGLIRFEWLRVGLARLLGDPRFRAFQLDHFTEGKIGRARRLCAAHGFTRQFSLAALANICNSGPGKMNRLVAAAAAVNKGSPGRALEDRIVESAVTAYARADIKEAGKKLKAGKKIDVAEIEASVEAILAAGFGRSGVDPAKVAVKSHYARRVAMLFRHFPHERDDPFTELGGYTVGPTLVVPEDYEPPPAGYEPAPAGFSDDTEPDESCFVQPVLVAEREPGRKDSPARPVPVASPPVTSPVGPTTTAVPVASTAKAVPAALASAGPALARPALTGEATPAVATPVHALSPAALGPEPADAQPVSFDRKSFAGLIAHNRHVGGLLLAAYDEGRLELQGKDAAQVRELADAGAYFFTTNKSKPDVAKNVCISHQALDVLEVLVRSSLAAEPGSFYILSLMREPKIYDDDPKKNGNHGRLFAAGSPGKDRRGRPVTGISSGIDVGGYGGDRIELANIGPSDPTQPLGERHRATFASKRARTISGVAAVMRTLPAGSYKLGLPVPAKVDAGRTGDEDLYVFLRVGMQIPPGIKARHPTIQSTGSPTGRFAKDLELVLEPARAALREALADNPNDPEIVVLMPDGVDHLHITVLGPGDRR